MEEKNTQKDQEEIVEEIINETEETVNEEQESSEEVTEETSSNEEIEKLTDSLQRLQAEYSNYRRRTTEEKATIGLFANEKILNDIIPVIDNMERAIEASDDKESTMYKGIEMVLKQLKDTIAKYGVEEIEAEGAEFDPNLHMAVMQEAVEGIEPNQVVMVLQKGYTIGSKVLRAAMVKVTC